MYAVNLGPWKLGGRNATSTLRAPSQLMNRSICLVFPSHVTTASHSVSSVLHKLGAKWPRHPRKKTNSFFNSARKSAEVTDGPDNCTTKRAFSVMGAVGTATEVPARITVDCRVRQSAAWWWNPVTTAIQHTNNTEIEENHTMIEGQRWKMDEYVKLLCSRFPLQPAAGK